MVHSVLENGGSFHGKLLVTTRGYLKLSWCFSISFHQKLGWRNPRLWSHSDRYPPVIKCGNEKSPIFRWFPRGKSPLMDFQIIHPWFTEGLPENPGIVASTSLPRLQPALRHQVTGLLFAPRLGLGLILVLKPTWHPVTKQGPLFWVTAEATELYKHGRSY
jgi:hypothetical protein